MLKIGIIGLSEGNGHPYSWSAIFNGYNKREMAQCGFPVISDYLSQRVFPAETIKGAEVTHIWTQDKELTVRVANSALISVACTDIEQMLNEVDAFLLARDDWQSHLDIGIPLLKTGKPVFIDKPISIRSHDLSTLLSSQMYAGQIFSCSSLRFSSQLRLSDSKKNTLGKIRLIKGLIPNSWEKYSVHLIDPIVAEFASDVSIRRLNTFKEEGYHSVHVVWSSGLISEFSTCGSLPSKVQIELVGEKSSETIIWNDAFSSFKASLEYFYEIVQSKNPIIEDEHHRKVVSIIEAGL